MITEYTVTDYYNQDCYNYYYRKSKKWEEYYDSLEDREDDIEGE